MNRCTGFDAPCGQFAKFVVAGSATREEWCGCESCAYQAHVYNADEVWDELGQVQQAIDAVDRLLAPAVPS